MHSIGTTHSDIERAIARGHQERSRVALDLLDRLGRWFGEILRPAAERFRRWNSERQAVAELRGLSNRTLADMGLHRSQIRAVVRALEDEVTPVPAAELVEVPVARSENLVPFPSTRRAHRNHVHSTDVEPIRAAG